MKRLVKIGASLLVIGIGLAVLGYMLGGSFSFTVNPKTHETVDNGDDGDYYVEDTISLEDFSSLDIHTGVADIEVKEGDAYQLDYLMYHEDKPRISVKDDTLFVQSMSTEAVHIGFDFEFFNIKMKQEREQPHLTITVPKGTELSDVTIYTESGDIKLASLKYGVISLTTEAGDVKFFDISSESIAIKSESGDGELTGVTTDELVLKSESGDITLTDVDCSSLDMTLEAGDADVKNCKFSSWKLLSESGDVKTEELIINRLNAKVEAGDAKLNIKGKKDDYGYVLSCDAGDIYLDGEEQGDHFVFGENKIDMIKVESECGDVKIQFE